MELNTGVDAAGGNTSLYASISDPETIVTPAYASNYSITYSPEVYGAVPEPSTWAMMLLGFAGLGFAGYRASRRTDGSSPLASERVTSL